MRVVDNVGFDVKKQDIPGGGSGGGNSQPLATPDWNQNDETAADYIKNRPFYTTDTTQIVQIPEQYIPPLGDYVSKNGGIINGQLTIGGMLGIDGVLMMLSDSGDLFSQIVVSDNKTIIMTMTPNGGPVGMTMFGYDDNGCATIEAVGENGAEKLFVIKTRTPTEDTHAANKKYVDDTVAAHVTDKKLILSSSTAGSAMKFEITVDDSGTLKATKKDS